MLCPVLAVRAAAALLAAGDPAATHNARCAAAPDSSAEAAIVAEVRAFYRDLDDQNWAPMLNHFIPAKVTARWAPPAASEAWVRLTAPLPLGRGAADGGAGRCEPRMAVAIVGDWARVRVRRCTDPADDVWLLRVSGRWKIVRLELATPPAAMPAACNCPAP